MHGTCRKLRTEGIQHQHSVLRTQIAQTVKTTIMRKMRNVGSGLRVQGLFYIRLGLGLGVSWGLGMMHGTCRELRTEGIQHLHSILHTQIGLGPHPEFLESYFLGVLVIRTPH